MATLDDLIGKAKDDETKNLLRQAADLAAGETRRTLEAAHAVALQDRERHHAEAIKAKDREHAGVLRVRDTRISDLENAVARQDRTIKAMAEEHQNAVNDYERQLGLKNTTIAKLSKSLGNSQWWAAVTTFTTMLLGINAATGRRRY